MARPDRQANAEAQKRYYRRHKAKADAACKAWRDANRQRVKARAHDYYLRRKTAAQSARIHEPSDEELDRRAAQWLRRSSEPGVLPG